tara:strand:- start:46 stop:552 length:507 start_codon:yes stop_codon:yes gene_type:complete
MYIRTKQRKNGKYAYLVKNKRLKTKKHPKQITIKYLGKVYTPEKIGSKTLYEPEQYIKKNSSKDIMKHLLELELLNHNFKKNKNIYSLDNLTVNLTNNKVTNNNNKISIELNEGFLNNYTLKQLFNYKHQPLQPLMEQGKNLANLLVSIGLKLDDEIFLRLFEKIHNP